MDVDAVVSDIYRTDWGRILANVIRRTGDFTIAEEATAEAFESALKKWRTDGVPEHPRAWLAQTARNAAIDRLRHRKLAAGKLETYAADLEEAAPDAPGPTEIPDDRLRLVFTCCHPSLALESQVALTLRTLLGLETDEIARSFLVTPETMAQRLVRAKKKIAEAKIPYVVPETSEMPERLHAVLTVLYLVFTEGYAATRGESLVRADLTAEAIRLTRIVRALIAEPEVTGALALMLLHDSRRAARLDENGDVVTLDHQDRTKWNAEQITEALTLVEPDPTGPFAVQAAISAVHARAKQPSDTDWREIARLYSRLEALSPSPVITLNRAVAIAMTEGPKAALAIVDRILEEGSLADYHLLHATRADFQRRLGDLKAAEESYTRARDLAGNESERRFLEKKISEVQSTRSATSA